MLFNEPGADDCSMTLNLRISTIISIGLMFMGQASTHALQVLQAQSSSSVM
jgi:hypothetical protein